MESHERSGDREVAATDEAGLGLIEAYLGDEQTARADADAAVRLAPKGLGVPTWAALGLAALGLALTGETTRAEKLANELNKNFPLDRSLQLSWLPTIRAAVALKRKNADKAVELLHEMSDYELNGSTELVPIYVRGRAFLMQGRPSAAAAEFQKIIDHPGIVGCNPVGALARLGLARAYALQGDTTRSRAAYQHLFALWKDADPDIRILQEAKAEYTKLQ